MVETLTHSKTVDPINRNMTLTVAAKETAGNKQSQYLRSLLLHLDTSHILNKTNQNRTVLTGITSTAPLRGFLLLELGAPDDMI